MALEISPVVPLKPGLRKRFYECLILLYCLKQTFNNGNAIEAPDVLGSDGERAAEKSRRELYLCYVNKISQICDISKGSDTVTACAVMQPGVIRYLLASNARSEDEMDAVKDFITDIISSLGKTEDDEIKKAIANKQSLLYSGLLRKIVRFNRPRVEHYLRVIARELPSCIESIENNETSNAVTPHLELLERLLEFQPRQGMPKAPMDEFVSGTVELMYALDGCYESSLEGLMREKCQNDKQVSLDGPWPTLRHATGRLMSYFLAVRILISTRRVFPELFSNFTVEPIKSSEPGDTPDIRKKVDGMVCRLTSDKVVVEKFRRHEPKLQEWGLNDKIKECTHPRRFQPIVHAELLVDDYIRREQRRDAFNPDAEPLEYFREREFGRYIGSSKPTCKNCWLYFSEHPDGVQVRPSHDNLYYKWRHPDIFESDSQDVIVQRNAVHEAIVKRLRDEIIRCIRTQSAFRNPFDSNNTASNPLRGMDSTASVTAMFSSMSVSRQSTVSSRESSLEDGERRRIENVSRDYLNAQAAMELPPSVAEIRRPTFAARKEQWKIKEENDDDDGGASI